MCGRSFYGQFGNVPAAIMCAPVPSCRVKRVCAPGYIPHLDWAREVWTCSSEDMHPYSKQHCFEHQKCWQKPSMSVDETINKVGVSVRWNSAHGYNE